MKPGMRWGSPATQPPDLEVAGSDRALATAHQQHPDARVRFAPDETSDLARALGLRTGTEAAHDATGPGTELHLDTFLVELPAEGGEPEPSAARLGVNLTVSGAGPWTPRWRQLRRSCLVEIDGRPWFEGRASAVVVANGQYHHGWDLVPRGHPGDGRLEVQVYTVGPGQRSELRRRLPTGTHVPHPGILTTTGREIRVRWRRPRLLQTDGERQTRAPEARMTVRPGTLTLVV